MMAAPALDTDRLRWIPGLSTKPVLRQAASFLADLVKPGVLGPPGEFDSDKVGGYFDDLEEANDWARRFYGPWVEELSLEEYSALEEYKKAGFRSLNRGLRDHDWDLEAFDPEISAPTQETDAPRRRTSRTRDLKRWLGAGRS